MFSFNSIYTAKFPHFFELIAKRRRLANPYLILSSHTDYVQEQEMEIEALEAILMDEFKGFVVPICVFLCVYAILSS